MFNIVCADYVAWQIFVHSFLDSNLKIPQRACQRFFKY